MTENKFNDSNRHMLRHSLATVAYRGSKAMRGATEEFARFRATNLFIGWV